MQNETERAAALQAVHAHDSTVLAVAYGVTIPSSLTSGDMCVSVPCAMTAQQQPAHADLAHKARKDMLFEHLLACCCSSLYAVHVARTAASCS
jgi:hypothetical protein